MDSLNPSPGNDVPNKQSADHVCIRANDRNREEYTCLPPLTTSR